MKIFNEQGREPAKKWLIEKAQIHLRLINPNDIPNGINPLSIVYISFKS